jgi:DNA transformation protein
MRNPARSVLLPDSSRLYALEVAGLLAHMGAIEVKRFFGGSGLLLGGAQFAFIMKGTLYLRVNGSTRLDFEKLGAQPFSYATSKRHVRVNTYFEAPANVVEDSQTLQEWASRAYTVALAAKRQPAAASGRKDSKLIRANVKAAQR